MAITNPNLSQTQMNAYAFTSGSANSYVATLSPSPTSYYPGMRIYLKFHASNTGASTLDVNGLGVKQIKNSTSVDLYPSQISANEIITVVYDGTDFILEKTPQRASDSEAQVGTDTVKFITPHQFKSNLDTRLADNLGAYSAKDWGTTYQATSSGMVVAKANSNSSSVMTILGYVGATSPAATLIAANSVDSTGKWAGICFPVAKGQYYMANYSVNGGISDNTVYFVPFK